MTGKELLPSHDGGTNSRYGNCWPVGAKTYVRRWSPVARVLAGTGACAAVAGAAGDCAGSSATVIATIAPMASTRRFLVNIYVCLVMKPQTGAGVLRVCVNRYRTAISPSVIRSAIATM